MILKFIYNKHEVENRISFLYLWINRIEVCLQKKAKSKENKAKKTKQTRKQIIQNVALILKPDFIFQPYFIITKKLCCTCYVAQFCKGESISCYHLTINIGINTWLRAENVCCSSTSYTWKAILKSFKLLLLSLWFHFDCFISNNCSNAAQMMLDS